LKVELIMIRHYWSSSRIRTNKIVELIVSIIGSTRVAISLQVKLHAKKIIETQKIILKFDSTFLF